MTARRRVLLLAAWIVVLNAGVLAWSFATREPGRFGRSAWFPPEALLAWFLGTAAVVVWFVHSYTAEQ